MTRKIKHDQYELVLCFKTDNVLAISAQFLPTGEHFNNSDVELMRINKETVLASLEKKSEKNLKSQLQQIVEQGKKWLQIVFVVNFDFLPEFREEVKLQYVQFKDNMKKVGYTNMRVQVEEINKALTSMETIGTNSHSELATFVVSTEKKEAWTKQVNDGKYMLRVSGTINNPSAYTQDSMRFFVGCQQSNQDQHETVIKSYNQPSYHYPFTFSDVVNCNQGKLKVQIKSNIANTYIYNLRFVLTRVVESC